MAQDNNHHKQTEKVMIHIKPDQNAQQHARYKKSQNHNLIIFAVYITINIFTTIKNTPFFTSCSMQIFLI